MFIRKPFFTLLLIFVLGTLASCRHSIHVYVENNLNYTIDPSQTLYISLRQKETVSNINMKTLLTRILKEKGWRVVDDIEASVLVLTLDQKEKSSKKKVCLHAFSTISFVQKERLPVWESCLTTQREVVEKEPHKLAEIFVEHLTQKKG